VIALASFHPAVDKWVAHRGPKTALCWTIGKPIPHYAHRRTDARGVDNKKPLPTPLLAPVNFYKLFLNLISQIFVFPNKPIALR
jgi:hypothetical protein